MLQEFVGGNAELQMPAAIDLSTSGLRRSSRSTQGTRPETFADDFNGSGWNLYEKVKHIFCRRQVQVPRPTIVSVCEKPTILILINIQDFTKFARNMKVSNILPRFEGVMYYKYDLILSSRGSLIINGIDRYTIQDSDQQQQ